MRYLVGLICVLALGVMPMVGCIDDGGVGGDGGTGGMPECEDSDDCLDLDDECAIVTCVGGVCEYLLAAYGAACAESNECAVGQCAGGACDLTPVANGTACGNDKGTCQEGSCQVACTEQGIRDAISAGGGPYVFDCDGPQTVVTDAEIVIDNDVILDGEGNVTVDGDEDHRVFLVEEGVVAGLRGLTVTKGGWVEPRVADESGGGIENRGTLSLANCSVTQCSVPSSVNPMGGWGTGAGISNPGILTMTNCTVSGNSADEPGGGIFNGGTARLTNSTVSGNTPGAILNVHEGTMAITNTTVSANGDLAIAKVGGPGTITITNSLIDGTCDVTDSDIACTSNGYNIESPGDTCGLDQDSDRVLTEAQLNLGPLQDNRGPTWTHALLPGSEAINKIPANECEVEIDQRGEPRPETGGTMCDVGAFEVQP